MTEPERRSFTVRGAGLLAFFSLTYLLSWSLFAAGAALSRGSRTLSGVGGLVIVLGVFAPAFVALALTARAGGRVAVGALLRRILPGSAGGRWYAFAIFYMFAIKLAAAVILRLATGAWPAFGDTPLLLMAGSILISTPVQAGEEIGWRGFALPRLAARFGLARAGVLLGLIWAVWHLPFFFIPVSDTFHQSFPVYLLQVTALSVALAWLYWRMGGNLLLVMLLHAAVNNTKDVVPSAVAGASDPFTLSSSAVAWLTVALLWVSAGYFLLKMRDVRRVDDSQPAAEAAA